MDNKTKLCKLCGESKDLSMFYVKQRVGDKAYLYAHCKACDKIKRQTLECKANKNEKQKERRKKNPDKFREYDKERRRNLTQDQKLRKAEYHKMWIKNNPEKIFKYRPKEKVQKYSKTYYAQHKEKIKQKTRLYKTLNLDKCREWRHNRENKMLGGSLSSGIVEKLYDLQKGKCACCGINLGNKYHLDHIIPISKGGANTDDNVQLLKDSCNMSKSARDPIEYMQSKGFLL